MATVSTSGSPFPCFPKLFLEIEPRDNISLCERNENFHIHKTDIVPSPVASHSRPPRNSLTDLGRAVSKSQAEADPEVDIRVGIEPSVGLPPVVDQGHHGSLEVGFVTPAPSRQVQLAQEADLEHGVGGFEYSQAMPYDGYRDMEAPLHYTCRDQGEATSIEEISRPHVSESPDHLFSDVGDTRDNPISIGVSDSDDDLPPAEVLLRASSRRSVKASRSRTTSLPQSTSSVGGNCRRNESAGDKSGGMLSPGSAEPRQASASPLPCERDGQASYARCMTSDHFEDEPVNANCGDGQWSAADHGIRSGTRDSLDEGFAIVPEPRAMALSTGQARSRSSASAKYDGRSSNGKSGRSLKRGCIVAPQPGTIPKRRRADLESATLDGRAQPADDSYWAEKSPSNALVFARSLRASARSQNKAVTGRQFLCSAMRDDGTAPQCTNGGSFNVGALDSASNGAPVTVVAYLCERPAGFLHISANILVETAEASLFMIKTALAAAASVQDPESLDITMKECTPIMPNLILIAAIERAAPCAPSLSEDDSGDADSYRDSDNEAEISTEGGMRDTCRKRRSHRQWTQAEDEVLQEWSGKQCDIAEIQERLAQLGQTRTPSAIRIRWYNKVKKPSREEV